MLNDASSAGSGIATMTRKYAKVSEGTTARVLDTRKIHSGMRILEKNGSENRWRSKTIVLLSPT